MDNKTIKTLLLVVLSVAITFFITYGYVLSASPTTNSGEKILLFNWDDTAKNWDGNENFLAGTPTTNSGTKVLPYAWDDTAKNGQPGMAVAVVFQMVVVLL